MHLQKAEQTASVAELGAEGSGVRTQVVERSGLVGFVHQPLHHPLANGQAHAGTHLRHRRRRTPLRSHERREFRVNPFITNVRERCSFRHEQF